jgi:hypothetical protein
LEVNRAWWTATESLEQPIRRAVKLRIPSIEDARSRFRAVKLGDNSAEQSLNKATADLLVERSGMTPLIPCAVLAFATANFEQRYQNFARGHPVIAMGQSSSASVRIVATVFPNGGIRPVRRLYWHRAGVAYMASPLWNPLLRSLSSSTRGRCGRKLSSVLRLRACVLRLRDQTGQHFRLAEKMHRSVRFRQLRPRA